ncbi:putative glycosyl hydrolase family 20 [Mycena chlorophos]|uniref:beta-N-acetylhexosaminidase n=1 Tax=Mycena chlorophos TaxID=658473 RepID=A0A8H6WLH5_MYCCL|nr:putative glycosyl hydrolase family 20 [Mycena chlorophos]
MLLHISHLVAMLLAPAAAKTLVGVPTFNFTTPSTGNVKFKLSPSTRVLVDSQFKDSVDLDGKTLIPPTLLQFAQTFAADLDVLGLSGISAEVADAAETDSIFLTLSTTGVFLDAAGRSTSEGYALTVESESVVIAGASPSGAFWGTRTLLQQAKLGELELPVGSGRDAPGWGTRGVMLDGGRHFYPLNDNLFNNLDIYTREESLDLYATFRLNSEDPAVDGLVKPCRVNETYTQETFDEMQSLCAACGVTIIPDIETSGHAVVIAQWKPELGLADLSLLNISYPETIPTMNTIWSTFLPWFHTKMVHIGADEYDSTLADEYILFVNTMSSFVGGTSGKES